MNTFTLVRTEHMNHNQKLFGGQLLKWIDENAWIVATYEHPKSKLVTRAIDNSEFHKGVKNGAILRFSIEQKRIGKTSLTYSVNVFALAPGEISEELIFSSNVTFVSIDEKGNKVLIDTNENMYKNNVQ